MKTCRTKLLSLFLALTMLLSLTVLPVSAAESGTLTVEGGVVAMTAYDVMTATLAIPKDQVKGEAADWAKTLTWSLTRDKSEQDPKLYPNVYTGDELKNWMTFGSNGTDGEAYFDLQDAAVVTGPDAGKVYIQLVAGTKPFFGALGIPGTRNFYGSVNGVYQLSVSDGASVLATADVRVDMYESYRRYDEIMGELEEIKKAAAQKGRYFNITVVGQSEDGYNIYYVTLSDSKSSVDSFLKMNATATTDPASLQAQIKSGSLKDYRVPFFVNNVHPDEDPGVDAQLNLLWELATQDTISYNTLTGLKSGEAVDMGQFDPKVAAIEGFTGLGSQKYTIMEIDGEMQPLNNDGVHDASELYNISDPITYKVDDLLDNLIFLFCPNENPDGRTHNSRRNGNGFDLNRDASNQTQEEPKALFPVVSQWNPVVFAELHGYMTEFLVEPCTPPHEPNLEYDLLVENFMLGSEAFGKAALGTMSKEDHDYKFWSYYTPLRDDYDPETTTWSAWDDLATNYGPSYAMLNSHSMGFTIEIPVNNEASTRIFECGMYGLMQFVMDNKDEIYLNQLEFFRRGIENIDAREKMDDWYVDINNKPLDEDTWRVPNEGNNNFFPEYWVIPVSAENQRDPADAVAMGQFLLRNGVQVEKLTADVTVDGVTYKTGDLVVNMYQAKRNYANAVLWQGADASMSGFPDLYSESVSNFPEMRGFTCVSVDQKDAFKGKTAGVTTVTGQSQFSGVAGKAVILSNNGTDAQRAVNGLLAAGKAVGLITEGADKGSFVLSHADYQSVAGKYILVAKGADTMPVAYQIQEPSVFLTGRYAEFSGAKIAEGYYAQWFKDGYGFKNYRNVHNNGTSNYDLLSFGEQMGFKLVTDPAKADVIVGSVALNQGETGEAAVAAVQAGTPYIAISCASSVKGSSLAYVKENLLPGQFDYVTLGMESLHRVTYPTDSIVTSTYAASGDDVLYSFGCGAIVQYPTGAQVLIQAAEQDSHIAGCCLTEDGKELDGRVEAIAYRGGNLDLTIFANSINNRTHQQDEYQLAANAIYSKCLAAAPMSVGDLAAAQPAGKAPAFTDVEGHWAQENISAAVEKGLFNDVVSTAFLPNAAMDRAMLVAALYRLDGAPAANAPSFSDVAGNAWFAAPVGWAVEQKVTSGTGADTFSPAATVTREQLAAFLYNYAKSQGGELAAGAALDQFSDSAKVSAWATEAMGWAVAQGLITGRTDRTLDPAGTATRAEVATILQRFVAAGA